MIYLGTDKWLEPRDRPEEPERDIVWELDLTLTLDTEGMWIAQHGSTSSIGYMDQGEAVKDLFVRWGV